MRHRLLRCYLDNGDGLGARELLDTMCTGVSATASTKMPAGASKSSDKAAKKSKGDKASKEKSQVLEAEVAVTSAAFMDPSAIKDKRSCCCYNRAFIEHISLLLDEAGAQEEIRDQLLGEGTFCGYHCCTVILVY